MAAFSFSGPDDRGYELNEDIVLLQSLWRTELQSPELLPYQSDLIEGIQSLLDNQQDLIDEKIDAGLESEYFTITLYQMEIERVRYSVVKYLRIRLQKIEEQLEMLLENPELLDRLSTAEKVFATKLFSLHQDLFEESILKRLPETNAQYFRTIDDRSKHAQTNMEKFVFCQMLADVSSLAVSLDTYRDYSAGDIAVLRYSSLRDLLLEGKVQLL